MTPTKLLPVKHEPSSSQRQMEAAQGYQEAAQSHHQSHQKIHLQPFLLTLSAPRHLNGVHVMWTSSPRSDDIASLFFLQVFILVFFCVRVVAGCQVRIFSLHTHVPNNLQHLARSSMRPRATELDTDECRANMAKPYPHTY